MDFEENPEYWHNEINEAAQESPHAYVRLHPRLRLDDRVNLGPALSASAFDDVYDRTVDAVNNDGELRGELRRAAKELVRRRRARQVIGGPRWEVFVGNTVPANDENERSEGKD